MPRTHGYEDTATRNRDWKRLGALAFCLLCGIPCLSQDRTSLIELPDAELAQRLSKLVTAEIQRERIPGLALALIRNNTIVFDGAWGYANTFTGSKLTNRTIFDAASLGKPIAAYVALTLVNRGVLGLDRPLHDISNDGYLQSNKLTDAITLRQVLTHTSGLPNEVWHVTSKTVSQPGKEFRYSGNGFMYLQHALEVRTGRSFDALAGDIVFGPMGMTSSAYVKRSGFGDRTANGHVPLSLLAHFLSMFILWAAIIVAPVGLVVHRVARRQWLPGPRGVVCLVLGSAVLALGIPPYFLGLSILQLTGPVTLLICAVMLFFGRLWDMVLTRLLPQAFHRLGTLLAFGAGLFSGMVLADSSAIRGDVPIPVSYPRQANAASSLHSTAVDLARFFAELSKQAGQNRGIGMLMAQPAVDVGDRISWGLGIGVSKDNLGTALWQWGDNPGSQSLALVYPSSQVGIVVLTNGLGGAAVARELARTILGSDGQWSLP